MNVKGWCWTDQGWQAWLMTMLLWAAAVAAQPYGPDDPVPPDARGEILELHGEILTLESEVLELHGEVLGLEATVESLDAMADAAREVIGELGGRIEGEEIRIDLSADVLFDFDSAALRAQADSELENVVAILEAHPYASVLIEGHTDGIGDAAYNQRLSEQRAQSVARRLLEAGIGNALVTRGHGMSQPVAPNAHPDGSDNPEGRQLNRRVEITVTTRQTSQAGGRAGQ